MSELCESTKKLNLNNNNNNKLLFVDILNYANKFFGPPEKELKPYKTLSSVFSDVKDFVTSASNCGWDLEIFIDDVIKTDEGNDKWLRRREDEVENRKREVPQATTIILGDMFRTLGVPVRYSFEADNDDTIMAHAAARKASVLSGDRDMFRYQYSGPLVKVWSTFYVENGKLTLVPHTSPTARSEPRQIIIPPPQTKSRMHDWSTVKIYQRGSPSLLTRDLGNLHIIVRPLRRAVYQIYNATVQETFPYWDEQEKKVKWEHSTVTPDVTLSDLLKEEPLVVLKHFFPSLERPQEFTIVQWHNHLWAVHAIVFELLAQAFPEKYSVFQLMLQHFKPTEELLRGQMEERKQCYIGKPPVHSVITCVDCRKKFEFLKSEHEFYMEQGYKLPVRCTPCRKNKRRY